VLAPTAAGRRAAARWLDRPVQHLRDVRTELLVKLMLRTRAGLDNESLLQAQRELFDPLIDALTSTGDDEDVVDMWRRESARAVRRFLDQALHPPGRAAAANSEMRLSARNQLRSTVTAIHHGEVMSTIKAVLGDGQPLTAAITKDAAHELDVAPGDVVVVVIKSTEVMVAKVE
jgi:molybdate transport system regulatory protein